MASNLEELIATLSEKESAMAELALVLTEEQSCIVGLDSERLVSNEQRKEKLLVRLAALQGSCAGLLRRALEERGASGDQRLSSLVAVSDGAERAQLAPLQQRLARRAAALEGQFRANRDLLEHSVSLIRNSMGFFVRMLGDCATYGARGDIMNGSTGGLLLRREI